MFCFNNKEKEDAIAFIEEFIEKYKHTYYNLLVDCIKNEGIRDLTKTEREKSHNFYLEHKDCCMKKTGRVFFSSIGGGFEYIVDWTPIGFIFTYKCNTCNESIDITDYSILEKFYNDHKNEFDKSYDFYKSIKPFSFIICGTGLGNCITIVENYTHESKDITDSDSW